MKIPHYGYDFIVVDTEEAFDLNQTDTVLASFAFENDANDYVKASVKSKVAKLKEGGYDPKVTWNSDASATIVADEDTVYTVELRKIPRRAASTFVDIDVEEEEFEDRASSEEIVERIRDVVNGEDWDEDKIYDVSKILENTGREGK